MPPDAAGPKRPMGMNGASSKGAAAAALLLAGLLLAGGPAQALKCENYPEDHPVRQGAYCQSQLPSKSGGGLLSDLINLPNTIVKDAADAVLGRSGEEAPEESATGSEEEAAASDAERQRVLEAERRQREAEAELRQRTEEAKRRAEEAKRALEQERQRAAEARRALEEERRKIEAEAERKREEEARRRAEAEAERRREEESRRKAEAEAERQRKEAEAEEAQRHVRKGVPASECVAVHLLSEPHHPANPYGITYIRNDCEHDVEVLYCSVQTGAASEAVRAALGHAPAADCKALADADGAGPVLYARRELLAPGAQRLAYPGKHALRLAACALQDGAGRFRSMAAYAKAGRAGYAYEPAVFGAGDAPGRFYCAGNPEEQPYKRAGYAAGPDAEAAGGDGSMVAEYLEPVRKACLARQQDDPEIDCDRIGQGAIALPPGPVEPHMLSYAPEECLMRKEQAKDDLWGRILAWATGGKTPYERIDCEAEEQARLAEAERKRHLCEGVDARAADERGKTPLHGAKRDKQANVLNWVVGVEDAGKLIECGADVHAKDGFGRTPLHEAALAAQADAVELLLEAGADVHAKAGRDDDATPLHSAVLSGYDYHLGAYNYLRCEDRAKTAQLLLEAGADADAKLFRKDSGITGKTPLHTAVQLPCAEVVRLLLEAGADVNAASQSGATPMDEVGLYWSDDELEARWVEEVAAMLKQADGRCSSKPDQPHCP